MKIRTNWTIGNFSAALQAEASEDQVIKLASLGLKYLGQRVSEVDKTLGGFAGKKRIAGWTRDSVPYEESLAEKLAGVFATLEFPSELGGSISPEVEIAEYVREEREPKFTAERETIKGKTAAEREALAEKIGFDGDDLTPENTAFAKAVRDYVDAIRKSL